MSTRLCLSFKSFISIMTSAVSQKKANQTKKHAETTKKPPLNSKKAQLKYLSFFTLLCKNSFV